MIRISSLVVLAVSSLMVTAQSTYDEVYNILQSKCASCHTAGHESGLELAGSPSEVFDQIYNTDTYNPSAAAKGNKVVYPGDPYESFLFRKINNELALDVSLDAEEGEPCPQGATPLDDKDIEMVRQWIIFGAKETGVQVEKELIETFYDVGGIQSIPSPPAPPDPEEGFQIHYGPFFLWPEEENEYFSKFATQLPEDREITRVDVILGDYSHHFIIYKYDESTYLFNDYGLREQDPEFVGVSLVTANQYSYDLELPEGTAFTWDEATWLDLNSHYVNYSSSLPLACEVFVNVYTQPAGTAVQEMHTDLPVNFDIYIPNNGEEYTFEQALYDPGDDDMMYLWGVTSHTHQWGSDYDVYLRNADGSRGAHIFDASCESTDGIPGCLDQIYDYQHPPIRYWDNFLPIVEGEGVIHEASYINNGPYPVSFGLTNDDEMMVLIYFYLEDTAGLNLDSVGTISSIDPIANEQAFNLQPNPADQATWLFMEELPTESFDVTVYDLFGKEMKRLVFPSGNNSLRIDRGYLPGGIYLIRASRESQLLYTGKVVFR
jgi:hypothetical protein